MEDCAYDVLADYQKHNCIPCAPNPTVLNNIHKSAGSTSQPDGKQDGRSNEDSESDMPSTTARAK
jgi:hypothetical protein